MDADPAYIARAACGCIIAAAVDRPEFHEDNAEYVSDWIRRGYSVERTTVEEARADPHFLVAPEDCPHRAQLVLSLTRPEGQA